MSTALSTPRLAVYPGSFDPVTNGHMDVIQRATKIFDQLIVGVAVDTQKSTTFTLEERVGFLRDTCAGLPRVTVESFKGLLVNWAVAKGSVAIVRGLRALSDFEYEFQMALANRKLRQDVETVFLMTREDSACISSSLVKQIAALGGVVTELVPACVDAALRARHGG
jgi:pantetheine-phosphate adenylyltransferase